MGEGAGVEVWVITVAQDQVSKMVCLVHSRVLMVARYLFAPGEQVKL